MLPIGKRDPFFRYSAKRRFLMLGQRDIPIQRRKYTVARRGSRVDITRRNVCLGQTVKPVGRAWVNLREESKHGDRACRLRWRLKKVVAQ